MDRFFVFQKLQFFDNLNVILPKQTNLLKMGIFSSFFSAKQAKTNFDFNAIKVDMHNHLLPGIDDGSKNMDQSIGMINQFA